MELDKLWQWQKRKLACRVRMETGNPSGDDLRERFAELGKVDLKELIGDMKNTKKKNEMANKTFVDYESEKKFKDVLGRSHIIGASQIALHDMEVYDQAHSVSLTQRNVQKKFLLLPKSPPRRVLLDIQRERAKPLRLPDQDDSNADTAKLEKKLAKQRAARIASIEKSEKEEESAKLAISSGGKLMNLERLQGVLKPYKGDLFSSGGTYMESMLYLSRMADSMNKSTRKGGRLAEAVPDSKTQKVEMHSTSKLEDELSRNGLDDQASGESSRVADLGSKLYCAATLCNWARNPANAARLASEGSVRAIMQLSLESMPRIAVFCAAAFRLMSEHQPLAISMIEEGAISTILDVVNSTSDEFICTNLAVALVNLSRINGREAQVVEAAIVLGLMNLILIRPDLSSACARGLYNLTCVDNAYPLIERVIRALISLSSSGTANVRHICAAALCNLADLKQVRARIVEEGAISVLGGLSRGSETRTRRICAVILQNLSASKSCRVEMVSRGCVSVAYGLSSDQDPIILRCIGLTLSRLALEPGNCARIISESGINALCNIAVKYPTIPGISQPVAAAFQLLSSRQGVRVLIVQEGSVTAIASLLRLSVDMFTLQHSLLALCNLLSEPDNHLPIVQQGLILTLISLSAQDDGALKDFSALAFLNLSLAEDSRKHLVNAGAIGAIINLSSSDSVNPESINTKSRCAAALCNVSAYEVGMARMVADGIIPALVKLVLADHIATVRFACAALCRICSTVDNANLILESGAVPNLVQRTLGGDTITKQFCGAVLSALSFYESCRLKLCELDMMSAMTKLAELNDDVTKQRCLVAFANMSCEESVHSMMVAQGVVGIIARLANSYQEVNYICCAKALCNLGCSKDLRMTIAAEKGVQALMMISLVHSVDKHTKLLCVIALRNLLDETSVLAMLEEGIVSSVANLSKIQDEGIENVCAHIFNQLSRYPEGRSRIVEKYSSMTALFNMLSSENVDTRMVSARTTCNLILFPQTRNRAIEGGALTVLDKGVQLDDQAAAWQCVQALFLSCSDLSSRILITKARISVALIKGVLKGAGTREKYDFTCKILAMLSWCSDSRPFLQGTKEFPELLIHMIMKNTQTQSIRWLAVAFRYLALEYPDPSELISLGAEGALLKLYQIETNELRRDAASTEARLDIAASCAETLRSLCATDDGAMRIASVNSLNILRLAVDICPTDKLVMYNVGYVLMRFAFSGSEGRVATSSADTVVILDALSHLPSCAEMVTTTLYMYLTDSKCRALYGNVTVASILLRIIDSNPSEDILYDAVSAINAMSRMASCRSMLSEGVNADMALIRISQADSERLKSNCARTLKNLTSDVNEAIGEGDVAALIAMSLEGKKGKDGDDISRPVVTPLQTKNLPKPTCSSEDLDVDNIIWYDEVVLTKGGAAGKGPDAPSPPVSNFTDNPQEHATISEEIEGGEMEGKTKMAFAKMQIPQDLRNKFLLTEADFSLAESTEVEDDSMSAAAAAATNGSGGLSGSADDSYKHGEESATILAERSQSSDYAIDVQLPLEPTIQNIDAIVAESESESKLQAHRSKKETHDSSAEEKPKKKSVKLQSKEFSVSDKAAQLGLYS